MSFPNGTVGRAGADKGQHSLLTGFLEHINKHIPVGGNTFSIDEGFIMGLGLEKLHCVVFFKRFILFA